MPFQWQTCYGGSGYEYINDIVETENGYLIVGTTSSDDGNVTNFHGINDIWVIKIDSVGTIEWERYYGGSDSDHDGRVLKIDDDNFYIIAETASEDGDIQSVNHGGGDVWIVKINGAGEILWEKCYGGSSSEDWLNFKKLTDGNILISCTSTSGDGDLPAHYGYYDSWIFIIKPEGNIIINAVFGNLLHNIVKDAIETQDGGFFIISTTMDTTGMVQGTYHGGMADIWAIKLDSDLNIQWQKLYGGSGYEESGWGLTELSDGYLFLALTDSNDGDVSGFHGGLSDIWVVRIDMAGNLVWQRCLGGSYYEFAEVSFQTSDNGFIIFGTTESNNGDVSGNNSWDEYYDIWVVKLNSEGEIEWQQCYGGLNDEVLLSGVIKKSDYNWVLAGSTKYPTIDVDCEWHGYEDYWIFEIKDTTTNIVDYQGEGSEISVFPNPAKDYVEF